MKVIEQLRLLSDERFLCIYEALVRDGFGPLDGEVAKALKFRPQAIVKIPMAKRAQRARRILDGEANAEMCYELFGTYLFTKHKQLVLDFLDGVGVEHDKGMISNVTEALPDPAKLSAALTELDQKYKAEDVTLYLSLCSEQWPSVPEVEAAWRKRLES
ncbi:MAG: hypothetical protein CMJ86_04265 [Planctomycetes bacterium]|nr:hypothetical protein [Planctomycetota bacterium]